MVFMTLWLLWMVGLIIVMSTESHAEGNLPLMLKCLWGHRIRTIGTVGCGIGNLMHGEWIVGGIVLAVGIMNAVILYDYEKKYIEEYNKKFNVN